MKNAKEYLKENGYYNTPHFPFDHVAWLMESFAAELVDKLHECEPYVSEANSVNYKHLALIRGDERDYDKSLDELDEWIQKNFIEDER